MEHIWLGFVCLSFRSFLVPDWDPMGWKSPLNARTKHFGVNIFGSVSKHHGVSQITIKPPFGSQYVLVHLFQASWRFANHKKKRHLRLLFGAHPHHGSSPGMFWKTRVPSPKWHQWSQRARNIFQADLVFYPKGTSRVFFFSLEGWREWILPGLWINSL